MKNRYLMYKMLGRYIEADLPLHFGGQKINGVVERIYRNVFHGTIDISLSGQEYSFREPDDVIKNNSNIVFLYGDVKEKEDDDVKTEFDSYTESVVDYLTRTSSKPLNKAIFKMGKVYHTAKYRWRNRISLT